MVMPIAAALPRRAAVYEAFIVLASLLLSAIFQYLMALVAKGGTKTHSSGSREFRSRYTSTVLFLGAYVWIKFREVAPESLHKPSRGLHRRCKVNEFDEKVYFGNYEPRFKPPGSDNSIYVGLYEKEEDARNIYHILAFYYGRNVPGELRLLNGSTYRIPCMTEEEQRLDPESKKEWAKGKAKDVFGEFKRALTESLVEWLSDSQAVQAAGDMSNCLPPDAGEGCDGQPDQLGNPSDGLDGPVSPCNSSPNVDPEIPVNVADDSCNDHAAAAEAGVSDEPAREPQNQHHASEGNQAINVNPDDSCDLRLLSFQIQQLQYENQQLASRVFALERSEQQQQFRISELESEAKLRSTKRFCVGLSVRHNS